MERDYVIVGPGGRELTITGPSDATPAQLRAAAEKAFGTTPAEKSFPEKLGKQVMNAVAGGVRGAGSIGATLLYPVDKITDMVMGDRGPNVTGLVTGKQPVSRNEERRQAMDSALSDLGADTGSLAFKGGKLAGEIAGTAGAGGAIANVASKVPALAQAPNLLQAIRTSGMTGGNMLTRAAGGAITGGASAGMVNPDDAGIGALVGGSVPAALRVGAEAGKLAGKAVRGALPQASPEVVALADRAKQLGIDLPADRLVNSRPMNALAASLNYVPLGGRAATEERMFSQFNRAVSRTMGQDTDNMAQALKGASADLGAKFDKVLKGNAVNVDQQFVTELADAANKASRELGSDGASIIAKQVDDIVAKAGNGQIDGQTAYNIKRTLDRIGGRNSPEAYYARDLKKALMGALDRSLGPQEAASFAKVRQQYGNMLELEGLVPNGAEGGLSIGRIANMRDIKTKDLQELADIAGQFLKSRESPHGAMQRLALGGIGATASGLGMAPYVAGTVVGARGANAALNSNALKALVTGKPVGNPLASLASPELSQLGYRAAPVLAADR